MPLPRRLKGWHAVALMSPVEHDEYVLSDSEPWLNEPVKCAVCGQKEIARDMDDTWITRTGKREGFCSECGGSRDSDVNNIMYYPMELPVKKNVEMKAKKPAAKKNVKTKAEKTKKVKTKAVNTKAVKTKGAVKTKQATRLSAK